MLTTEQARKFHNNLLYYVPNEAEVNGIHIYFGVTLDYLIEDYITLKKYYEENKKQLDKVTRVVSGEPTENNNESISNGDLPLFAHSR